MLSFYKKSTKEGLFIEISGPELDSWIHIESVETKDLEFISDLLNLQISDLTDALDYHELPRIERLVDCLIFFTRHPIDARATLPGHLHTIPLTILLSPSYFITISLAKSSITQDILQKQEIGTFNPSKLLLQVLKKVAHEFGTQIKRVRNSVMAQGKEMNAVDSEDIFRLTEQEEILNQYVSSLSPFNAALAVLDKLHISTLHKKKHKELSDIINSVRQSENICAFLVKNIRSLRDSYQIVFANKLTKTIKLLTSLTIIFSVPTMIASIYGMNVSLPFAQQNYAFAFLIIFMVISSVLCGYWFYRKKWM